MSNVIKWNQVTKQEFWGRFGDAPPVRTWKYGYLMGEAVNYCPSTGKERYLAYWNPKAFEDVFFKADQPLTIDEFQTEINYRSEITLREWSTGKISWDEFINVLAN